VVWEFLQNGYLDCEAIIDPVVPFVQAAEGFMEYVDRNPDKSIKLGIDFSREVTE
jgi:threonine dehydrogenase-like Zn-dependent dehydrogenase